MKTINERLASLPGLLKYESPAALAKACGIDPNTLRRAMAGPSKPGFDILHGILDKHEELSPDWFLRGVGPKLRDGLTQTAEIIADIRMPEHVERKQLNPMASELALTASRGGKQPDEYVGQLLERIADQGKTIEKLWKQNDKLLDRKPSASPDAAGLYAFADSLAIDYPCPGTEVRERLQSIAKFRPAARVIRMHVAGFQQQAS